MNWLLLPNKLETLKKRVSLFMPSVMCCANMPKPRPLSVDHFCQYSTRVRNRSSDFSCFWKCNILSFFPFQLESWRPLQLQTQKKGCAFVSCQWKRLPALPAWVMPHRLNTQTDKITQQTDWSPQWLLLLTKIERLYCCNMCKHVHSYQFFLF